MQPKYLPKMILFSNRVKPVQFLTTYPIKTTVSFQARHANGLLPVFLRIVTCPPIQENSKSVIVTYME